MEILLDHRDYGSYRSLHVDFGPVVLILTIRPEGPIRVVDDRGDGWITVIDAHGADDTLMITPDRTTLMTGRAQIGVTPEDAESLLRVFRGEWPVPIETNTTLADLAAYYAEAPEDPDNADDNDVWEIDASAGVRHVT